MPFGITTASVLNRSLRVCLAISLTAIFAVIRSINGSSIVPIAFAIFWEFVAAWKVATIGPSPAHPANKERDGIAGSCRCNRSNSPLAIHCLTLDDASGPKITFATAPLYGIEIGRPAETTQGSIFPSSSVTGASTETSWPLESNHSACSLI